MKLILLQELFKFRNMRDPSVKSLYDSNLRRDESKAIPLTERIYKSKRGASKKSLHKSQQDFFEHMKKYEEQKNQKMLKLIIDKEKREISQLNTLHTKKR